MSDIFYYLTRQFRLLPTGSFSQARRMMMAKQSGSWNGARAAMAFQRENGVLSSPVPTRCPRAQPAGTPGTAPPLAARQVWSLETIPLKTECRKTYRGCWKCCTSQASPRKQRKKLCTLRCLRWSLIELRTHFLTVNSDKLM